MGGQKLMAREIDHFARYLVARKLMVREFLKCHFRPELDGILQYFSPAYFYPIHLRVNKPEKKIIRKPAR